MSKVINITPLRDAIVLHCSWNRIDLPEHILNDIVQRHESIQRELTEGFYSFKQAYHEYTLEMKIFKSAAQTELHVRRVRDNECVFTHTLSHLFIEKENKMPKAIADIIDISKLKLDITFEFAQKNLIVPDAAMFEITQMHLPSSPTEGETKFVTIGLVDNCDAKYNCHVKVNKLLGRTGLCAIMEGETAPTLYCTINHSIIEKRTTYSEPREKEAVTDRIKNTYQNVRLNALLGKLKTTATPTEAFQLLCDYLEEDTEISSTLSRKETVIQYSLRFDKATGEFALKTNVFNKDNREKPIINFEINIDNKNIEVAYQSILNLMNLVK